MQWVRKFRPEWLYLGIGCLILISFAGCGRAVNRTAERRIREALPDLLGTARQYKVHVEGSAERTIGGRLSRVTVDGDDVELSNGLLLDHLHLDLQGVDYDTRRRQVRAIKEAHFQATLSSNTLDVYLAGESPPNETLRHPRVTFGAGNEVTIAAERITLGIGVPFRLTGPLRIAGPRRLEIDPTRLVVVGIPFTGAILRFLVQRFEGAGDLSPLPFPVQLTGVQTAPGTMTLSGTADVAAILKRAQKN